MEKEGLEWRTRVEEACSTWEDLTSRRVGGCGTLRRRAKSLWAILRRRTKKISVSLLVMGITKSLYYYLNKSTNPWEIKQNRGNRVEGR